MVKVGYISLIGRAIRFCEVRDLDTTIIYYASKFGRLSFFKASIHKCSNKCGFEVWIEVRNTMACQTAFGINSPNYDSSSSDNTPSKAIWYSILVVGNAFQPPFLVKVAYKPMQDTTAKEAFKPITIIEIKFCFSMKLRKHVV